MPNILCRIGRHRWRRYALPLNAFQEDALRLGYPVAACWALECRRCLQHPAIVEPRETQTA